MSNLTIINPTSITDAMLLDTNILENDYPEWSSTTTYATAARVIKTSTHKIYESLQDGNLNKDPETEASWWIEVSATNRWKAFDTSNSTQTEGAASVSDYLIYYKLQMGMSPTTSVAALNISNPLDLQVIVTSPSYGEVYNETFDLRPMISASDWWSWFFGERTEITQKIITDLPAYYDSVVEFSLTGGEDLALGVLILGQQRIFGLGIQYGARIGIQDFSRKETNEFGDMILVKRAYARRASFDLMILSSEVDSFIRFLSSIATIPTVWIGPEEYEALTIFGIFKTFDITISYPNHALFSVEMEGLT